MAQTDSPFKGVPSEKWPGIIKEVINAHPLQKEVIVETVLTSWNELHATQIGSRRLQIGKDIFPNPQILGFLLHELIPVELAALHPTVWRREKSKGEKDLVYVPNPYFSVEIKTSSHPSQIFGNRSYAQKSTTGKSTAKSGYFLTVNFKATKEDGEKGRITRIRFGWLDHSDWIGQAAQTGQQSRLTTDADKYKLVELYPTTAVKAKLG